MPIAKVVEITSESSSSFSDAIEAGVRRASETLKNVQTAWVKDQQVVVTNGKVSQYRVALKVTFVLAE